jgi:hypothetical protein
MGMIAPVKFQKNPDNAFGSVANNLTLGKFIIPGNKWHYMPVISTDCKRSKLGEIIAFEGFLIRIS